MISIASGYMAQWDYQLQVFRLIRMPAGLPDITSETIEEFASLVQLTDQEKADLTAMKG